MDAIVAIARATLKLCPTGHPDHVLSLTTLAAFLRRRYQQQGAVADVNEAVILYQETLEVCPSGSVASAPSFARPCTVSIGEVHQASHAD